MTTILGDKFTPKEVESLMAEAVDGKIDYERRSEEQGRPQQLPTHNTSPLP